MPRSRRLAGLATILSLLLRTTTAQDSSLRLATLTGVAPIQPTSTAPSTTTPPPPPPTSAPAPASATSAPQVHTIKVGAGGFRFTPQALTDVAAGDAVTFEFYPPDHSVYQAEYGSACVPYSYADKDHEGKGFWVPTQLISTPAEATHFNITVNDTQPIFFYCAAPGSCTDKLMVGAINPNATQTLEGQIQAAKDADFQLALGDPVPNEATATIRNGPTSTANHNQSSGGSSGGVHLSGGAIAGIVVGAVAFLVICAALFFFVGRSKSLKEVINRQDANVRASGSHMGGPGTPYSPSMGYAEVSGHPSPYGQHNATDMHPSGWASPNMQHASMMSQTGGMSQEQLDYYKQMHTQQAPVEMHSPQPGQGEFAAELEAPNSQKAGRT